MFEFFKKLFASEPVEQVDIKALYKKGAVLIDVRTVNEFNSGHIKKAKNIPLQIIPKSIDRIKKMNKPVITYCRSGQRSKMAARILNKNGIKAYNGGGYINLNTILK